MIYECFFASHWLRTEALSLDKSIPITPSAKEGNALGDTRRTFMPGVVGSASFFCPHNFDG